jgi:hypothetical protein
MARQVANVDIITDSFEIWLLETNELLNALSTEVMTANATYANTGNSTFQRTGQLYGTFGANNVVVSDWIKGGNVNGSFANLMVSTNAVLSNTTAANLMLMVANSTTFSYINPQGGYFGNTTANSFINSIAIITQSNSIVNTNISPTLIQVANSTATSNVIAGSFKTGLFQANTTTIAVGANVIANASALYIAAGSNTAVLTEKTLTTVANLDIINDKTTFSNAVAVTGNTILSNTLYTTGAAVFSNTIAATGNVTFSNTLAVTGAATLSNTLGVTGAATLSNTLTVTGLSNTSGNLNTPTANASVAINVGANVNLTTTRVNVGNSTVNTAITSTAIDTDGTLAVLGTTTLSNTADIAGLANAAGNLNTPTANASVAINVGANVNLSTTRFNVGNTTVNTFITSTAIETDGTLTVLGATTLSNTLSVTGLTDATGNLNTPTANASVAVNVGANVNLTAARFNVGNTTVNTFITSTAIETDGTLTVLGATTLSNTLGVTGAANVLSTLGVTGAANLQSTLGVAGAANVQSTLGVFGAATFSNTITITGLTALNGGINTTTANASAAVNVGANVNLTLDRINVGNTTVNTFITSTAIDTDGTLAVTGAATLSNTLGVTGATTLSNTLNVVGAANLQSSANIASTLGIGGALTVGGITTLQTNYVIDVAATADVGSTIGPVLVYRFPKATYASGKFKVQVKNGNTQLSELVLAHDGGTLAYVTVYGTVSSNGGASPLGTFTANTDTANVNLYLVQTVANSSVKVIAHLIK